MTCVPENVVVECKNILTFNKRETYLNKSWQGSRFAHTLSLQIAVFMCCYKMLKKSSKMKTLSVSLATSLLSTCCGEYKENLQHTRQNGRFPGMWCFVGKDTVSAHVSFVFSLGVVSSGNQRPHQKNIPLLVIVWFSFLLLAVRCRSLPPCGDVFSASTGDFGILIVRTA